LVLAAVGCVNLGLSFVHLGASQYELMLLDFAGVFASAVLIAAVVERYRYE
jgi:hypothetical protein